MAVTDSTTIEDLVREIPGAVGYLSEHGIRCIRCGEPIWGTLGEAAKEKGYGENDVSRFIEDLNRLSASKT